MLEVSVLKLPSFICVGPGRTGTTWLHAALTGYVGLPLRVKETRFWGQYYHKGIGWYADHFRHCDPARPIGEACPYFATEGARERIARHLPNCKIIVTLRDPVERSYSQYRMLCRMGLARGTFEQELNHPRIVETNRYAFHLQGWFDLFGRDKVKVLLFDELRKEPQKFLDQVTDFIGAQRISLDAVKIGAGDVNSYIRMPRSRRLSRRVGRLLDWMHDRRLYRVMGLVENTGLLEFCLDGRRKFPAISSSTEMKLREGFISEVEAVERLTALDLAAWKKPRRVAGEPEAARRRETVVAISEPPI